MGESANPVSRRPTVVPAIFLVATALLSIAAFVERPWVSLCSPLSILLGIPVYIFGVRPRQAR